MSSSLTKTMNIIFIISLWKLANKWSNKQGDKIITCPTNEASLSESTPTFSALRGVFYTNEHLQVTDKPALGISSRGSLNEPWKLFSGQLVDGHSWKNNLYKGQFRDAALKFLVMFKELERL